ncbi:MAG: dual specificity protein phosphatase family protein [Thermodesulfobacteriota bacterium]
MDYILDNLAIGHFNDTIEPPREISALLCVAKECDIDVTPLSYHKVPIEDMRPIPSAQLKQSVTWIYDHIEDHRIMVFCNAGVGRSPSVVVAYLCCMAGYGFGEAVEFVAVRKPKMSILPDLITSIGKVKEMLAEESPAPPKDD